MATMFNPFAPLPAPKPAAAPIQYVDLHFCGKCGCHYSTQCPEHRGESVKVRNPPRK